MSIRLTTPPTNQVIAAGDGATKSFTFGRAIGGYYEPVSYVTSIASVTVADAATTAYTFTAPNHARLHHGADERRQPSPPLSPTASSAASSTTGRIRNFLSGLWKIDGLKFRQVR